MDLILNKETHEYFVNDIKIPSVSDVLNLLAPYSGFITEHDKKKGRWVHRASEFIDQDRLNLKSPEIKDDVRGYLEAWIQFKIDHPGIGGLNLILDIKIGVHFFKRTEIQLIGYHRAAVETYERGCGQHQIETPIYSKIYRYGATPDRVYFHGGKFDNLWEVNLNADGTYKVYRYKYTKPKFNAFLSGLFSLNYRNL